MSHQHAEFRHAEFRHAEPFTAPTRREHAAAVLLALFCAVVFLGEALLPGRALVPHPPEVLDVPMAEAIARGTFDPDEVFRGNVGMTDKYLQSLCWDRVMHDRLRAGELPRWTNDIGGGAPFVPQMAQPWQPINLLLLLLPNEQWYGVWYLIHQVLFGWFAYAFLRRLGCGHGGALLGLVCAVLGLWTQCKLHHNVILTAALSLWPMLSATHELVVNGANGGSRRRAIAWLGLWSGLSWSTGFVVVALQCTELTIACALFWLLQAPRGERLRRLVPVGFGFALGALLSAANMLPILAAAAESARPAFDAKLQRALGLEWDHALTLLWPDLLSWAADRFYLPAGGAPWDYQTRMPLSQLLLLAEPRRPEDGSTLHSWVESSWAIGLVPFALAPTALFGALRRTAIWFLLLAVVSFGLATADEPFLTLGRLIPGFGAGDPRRQLFAASMALVVVAALGVDAQLTSSRRWPALLLGGAAAAMSAVAIAWLWQRADVATFVRGMVELFALDADHPQVVAAGGSIDAMVSATLAALQPGEAEHNRALLLATAWRAFAVAGLGIAALWLRPRPRIAVWILLTIGELWHAGRGPVQTVAAERLTRLPTVLQPAAAAAQPNGERPRLCRLVAPTARNDMAFPGNLPGFHGLEDGIAYNPLPKARYMQFFGAIDAAAARGGSGVGSFQDPAALQHPLCDLYGLRFVLTRVPVVTTAGLVDRTPPATGGYRLLERTTALPLLTFVQQTEVIADAKARLATLARTDRDVARTMVLEAEDAPRPDAAPAAAVVELVRRTDERVEATVRTQAAGYLRLADPWDAGWRATLDGAPVPIFVADHLLRAVFVPAGEHRIEFRYDGMMVVWPLRLTILAWSIVAVLWWSGRRC
jgi:hypothetical protein